MPIRDHLQLTRLRPPVDRPHSLNMTNGDGHLAGSCAGPGSRATTTLVYTTQYLLSLRHIRFSDNKLIIQQLQSLGLCRRYRPRGRRAGEWAKHLGRHFGSRDDAHSDTHSVDPAGQSPSVVSPRHVVVAEAARDQRRDIFRESSGRYSADVEATPTFSRPLAESTTGRTLCLPLGPSPSTSYLRRLHHLPSDRRLY